MISIKLDPKELLDSCKYSKDEVEKALTSGVNKLASAALTYLVQLTKSELNPHQSKMFIGGEDKKNIEFTSIDPLTHVITIKDTAVLIDNGEKIDMKTDKWLFKSKNTKQGKNGKYLAVPFEHGGKVSDINGTASKTARFESNLTGRIKEELDLQNKKRKVQGLPKITMSGIERDSRGQIKEGHLHTFDVYGSKVNPVWSDMPLTRLNVYQKIKKDEKGNPLLDKKGKAKVVRSWMTFRTASEGVPDKFWYPAPKTKDFLQRTGEWAEKEFYEKIVPEILAKWKD